MPAAENREQLLEMQLLGATGDVRDLVGIPGLQPMLECGQVRSRVIKTTVTLLNQRRILFELRDVFKEDGDRAFALLRNAFFAQFLDERLQSRVVETLAQCVIELHSQPRIN